MRPALKTRGAMEKLRTHLAPMSRTARLRYGPGSSAAFRGQGRHCALKRHPCAKREDDNIHSTVILRLDRRIQGYGAGSILKIKRAVERLRTQRAPSFTTARLRY